MSSPPISFNKLVQQVPQFENALDPRLRALIGVLAKREEKSPEAWLSEHISMLLGEMLEEREPQKRLLVAEDEEVAKEIAKLAPPRLRPAVPQRLEDWKPLPPERLVSMLCPYEVDRAARALRPEIEALLSKVEMSDLDRRRVPAARRLRFFDGQVEGISAEKGEEDKVAWMKRLSASGNEREILRVRKSIIRRVERLLVIAPNMREATRHVLHQLALSRRDGNRLAINPILLIGPPAAGKTWWAEQIALALGVRSELVSMGGVSSSFEVSGSSRSWNSARPGRILRAFIKSLSASPVFVLDEIDKISAGNYDPAPVLLSLMERMSARRFRDEFFDMDFDVSRSIFIATANYPEHMDPALRSRFDEIIVRVPLREERLPIIESLWHDLRIERAALRLPAKLEPAVAAILIDEFCGARQARRMMEEGLGRAAHRDGELKLLPSDLGDDDSPSSPAVPFGFGPRP
jgi:hypothetical protein